MSSDATIALWKMIPILQNFEKMNKGIFVFDYIEIQEKPAKTYTFNGIKKENPIIPTAVSFLPNSPNVFAASYKTPYVVQFDIESV